MAGVRFTSDLEYITGNWKDKVARSKVLIHIAINGKTVCFWGLVKTVKKNS